MSTALRELASHLSASHISTSSPESTAPHTTSESHHPSSNDSCPTPLLTRDNGAPLVDNEHSLIAGEGYVMLQDYQLLEKLATFNRERIPERIVHARGTGVYGYFEVTHTMSHYTKAAFLSESGKRTPVFVRFSTVRGGKESNESNRDPRGFSIKHYTEQGIYDMVGNNTPIFFIRDPSLFVDLIHAFKLNPHNNLSSNDAMWDFGSLIPESIHQYLFLMSPRGIPRGYRYMNGYSSHTYKWVNHTGEEVWVKYHYKTDQGIKNYTQKEADELQDPAFATRDLFESIANGIPSIWTLYVQIIPTADVKKYKWNIFDITKVIPHTDYPLQMVGKLVLNRNPINYFNEVEQVSFAPSNLVPGIEPSPDRMLQARLFAYDDAARYRLGVNFHHLPINKPINEVKNQHVDGVAQYTQNGGSGPNYYPNSLSSCPMMNGGHLSPYAEKQFHINSVVGRNGYPQENLNNTDHRDDKNVGDIDFEQPRQFWRNVLSETDKEQTVEAIVTGIVAIRKEVQERVIQWMGKVDDGLAKRIQEGLERTKLSDQPLH